MDRWIEDRVAYLLDLQTQIRTVTQDEDFQAQFKANKELDRFLSTSSYKFHWFEMRGVSKGDYRTACYESPTGIRAKVEKDAVQKLKKIDVAVAKKINFDVTAVEQLYVTEGKDGYVEGAWLLNGEKTFSFETIYAGGYNIQCLHVRTKYKLK